MYKAHYEGKADIKGFRGLGVGLRVMSSDCVIIDAIENMRQQGLSGVYGQKQLATIIFDHYNPIEVYAEDNVITGTDKPLWGSIQACQNALQDVVKNNLNDGFFRCDRKGDPVGDKRAWGYYVIPSNDDRDITLDIQTAWVEPC